MSVLRNSYRVIRNTFLIGWYHLQDSFYKKRMYICIAILLALMGMVYFIFMNVRLERNIFAPMVVLLALRSLAPLGVALVGIFLAADGISEVYEKKQLDILLSKPFGKMEFFFGRLLGSFGSVAISLLIAVLIGSAVGWYVFGYPYSPIWIFLAYVGLLMGAILFASITFCISAISRRTLIAVVMSLAFVVASLTVGYLVVGTKLQSIFYKLPTTIADVLPMALGDPTRPPASRAAYLKYLPYWEIYTLVPILVTAIVFRLRDLAED